MENTVYIYALTHPDTREIRYIGSSVDPEYRLEQHIENALAARSTATGIEWIGFKPTPKDYWICCLLSEDKKPGMIILDSCDEPERRQVEKTWIKLAVKNRLNILNVIHNSGAYDDWYYVWWVWRNTYCKRGKFYTG